MNLRGGDRPFFHGETTGKFLLCSKKIGGFFLEHFGQSPHDCESGAALCAKTLRRLSIQAKTAPAEAEAVPKQARFLT